MQIKAVLLSFCPFKHGMTFWAPRLENVELLGFNWVETFPLQCVSPNDTNLNYTSLIVIPSVMIFLIIIFLGHVFYLSALNWWFGLMTKHQLYVPCSAQKYLFCTFNLFVAPVCSVNFAWLNLFRRDKLQWKRYRLPTNVVKFIMTAIIYILLSFCCFYFDVLLCNPVVLFLLIKIE